MTVNFRNNLKVRDSLSSENLNLISEYDTEIEPLVLKILREPKRQLGE